MKPQLNVEVLAFLGDDEEHEHEAERVLGTNWSDTLEAGGGPQEIFALNGNDIVRAGGGPDLVYGGNGRDYLFAEGGPDQVFGGNGKDYLQGGGGPDVMDGGNGNDILIGCMARDILTGGNGADVFVYRSASEAPAGGAGEDSGGEEDHEEGHEEGDGCTGSDDGGAGPETITDFQVQIDRIQFSDIATVFGFSTEGPTENSVWLEQVGLDVLVKVDADGNIEGEHPEDMLILLLNVDASQITADDFIF